MRRLKTVLMIVPLTIMSLIIQQKVEASFGDAKVYIINLAGVPSSWVDNKTRVADGAIDACMVRGCGIDKNVPRAHICAYQKNSTHTHRLSSNLSRVTKL